jgi:hypothetical protein
VRALSTGMCASAVRDCQAMPASGGWVWPQGAAGTDGVNLRIATCPGRPQVAGRCCRNRRTPYAAWLPTVSSGRAGRWRCDSALLRRGVQATQLSSRRPGLDARTTPTGCGWIGVMAACSWQTLAPQYPQTPIAGRLSELAANAHSRQFIASPT